MKAEKVDEFLANYREYSARCGFLEHELRELRRLADELKKTALTDAISITQVLSDMPHGSGISDPIGRLVEKFADGYMPDYIVELELEITNKENEYKRKIPVVVFVESWLRVLTKRERFVIENKTIGGMFWRELVMEFKKEFGEEYSRQGLKKIRDNAIEKIHRIAE